MRDSRLKVLPLVLAVLVVCVAAAQAGERAYLGVMLQPLTVDLKEAMDVERDLRGVLISDIVDGSPADEYGLKDGDIIVEIDGEAVETVKGAVEAIKSHAPGDEVKIVVMRDRDKKEVVTVKLGERGEDEEMSEKPDLGSFPGITRHFQDFLGEPEGYLGVRIDNISTSDLGDYFGVDKHEGVLVVEVVEDSPAEDAGILAGDVILKVDGKEVSNTGELTKYIRKNEPGDDVELTIKRKHRTRTVEVELGKTETGAKLFMKGHGAPPGKYRRGEIKLPDIDKIMKKAKIYHDDDGHIKVYKYGDDDLEDVEILGLDSDQLEQDMEDLEGQIQDLKEELKGLKKELEELRAR